jgi:hypothetical protein
VLIRGILAGLAVAGALELFNVLAWRNCHTVIPGVLYRCAQPSAGDLERLIDQLHIRTVVNLRGVCDASPWFMRQARVTSERGVSQEDLAFSASRLPPAPAVRALVRVIDHSEYPLVFHCNRGIDRTGMAVAVALLLHTDAPVAEARRNLSLRHGHLEMGRTAYMDRFFDLYEDWLAGQGLKHSRPAFRRWAEHEYCPGACRAAFKLLDPVPLRRLPRGEPVGIPVRCKNIAVQPWRFLPGTAAGISCGYVLFNDRDENVYTGSSGLFHALVPPGEAIDLTLALPPLEKPGKYTLRVDMYEGQHGFFFQLGSEPYFYDLEVL